LIVDWDVHHGNGTQAAFYADPQVLFVSLHQDDWYPTNSGSLAEQGAAEGAGFTINIPLPPGTGDKGYLAALHTIVAPAARRFRPELIIISAGQDAGIFDPLGKMFVSMQGFREMGAAMRELAEALCGGRLLMVQEGGYSLPYTPFCTLGALEGITGSDTGVPDAYATVSEMAQARGAFSEATQQTLASARQAHHRHLAG
jgi:acetoin utilization deacetylase AcuC-like enzyme